MTGAPIALILGALLGAGSLLMAAHWMWPIDDPARATSAVRPLGDALTTNLALAGLPDVPLAALVVISIVVGGMLAGVAHAIIGITVVSVAVLALGVVGPTLVIGWRAAVQRRQNRAIWPDVLDHLVAGVRSGSALPEALAALADSGPVSVRTAFAGFSREYSATSSFGPAVDHTKAVLGDPTADRILETLRMAREVGGTELASVLLGLGRHLRAEAAVRAELEARQGWVMNAARLGAVAPWIVLLMMSSRPEAVTAFNSPEGAVLLVIGALVTVVAYRVMVAIGRLPDERRWFA